MRTAAFVAVLALVSGAQEQEMPKPGKDHGYLKQFEGTWDTKSKFVMDPSQPAMEGKGTATFKLICGGLWLVSDYAGEMGEMGKFEGHGIMGYDTGKKKFVGCWVDNMITKFELGEGDANEKGTVITLVSETPQGKTKQIYEVKDKDLWVLSFAWIRDGKEENVGSVEFKRKK